VLGPTVLDVGPELTLAWTISTEISTAGIVPLFSSQCVGVPILGPAHSRPIVRSDSISMVSDRSLQYIDGAWSAFVVVNRAEDASRLDGHHTHSKLAPCHALDLRAKVNRCK